MASFASSGFDISSTNSDVVHELDGSVTPVTPTLPPPKTNDVPNLSPPHVKENDKPLHAQMKTRGNNLFKSSDYLGALELYTSAITECEKACEEDNPDVEYVFNERLVEMIEEREHAEKTELAKIRREKEEEERRQEKEARMKERGEEPLPAEIPPTPRTPTPQPPINYPPSSYRTLLSTYHNNAAACLLPLGRLPECKTNCDIALSYDPEYIKAYIRRAKVREKILDKDANPWNGDGEEGEGGGEGDIDGALSDIKKAIELMSLKTLTKSEQKTLTSIKLECNRLQKLSDARMEKMKEETMGKLKDLGNSLLSNFGLSLDNFTANQDPVSGGYSIGFNNK